MTSIKIAKIPLKKLQKIKLFLFDFDGVFTSGKKGENFNERDLMGINMLRFGYYLVSKNIPKIGIVTGEKNKVALSLAKREHFDYSFLGVKNKKLVLDFLEKKAKIRSEESAVIYDDLNDLPLVEKAGLRLLVNQHGSLVFQELMRKQKKFDYLTKTFGGQGAVREICELILNFLGIYPQCLKHRGNFTKTYQDYWKLRNSLIPTCFVQRGNKLKQIVL